MLDGPATSLINEMVLYSNSKEIERVMEYDQLGNIVSELGIKPVARLYKKFQGLKYDSSPHQQATTNMGNMPQGSVFGRHFSG